MKTKIELNKQLAKRGFKFSREKLEKERIGDLRKLLKALEK